MGLALVLWVAAPVAWSAAAARSAAGSLAFLLTCFAPADSSPAGAYPGPPGHSGGGRDACSFCQACCGGAAPMEARPGEVGTAPVQSDSPAWTVADRALPTPRRDHSRLARAPPSRRDSLRVETPIRAVSSSSREGRRGRRISA
jgi:hypothetical protein